MAAGAPSVLRLRVAQVMYDNADILTERSAYRGLSKRRSSTAPKAEMEYHKALTARLPYHAQHVETLVPSTTPEVIHFCLSTSHFASVWFHTVHSRPLCLWLSLRVFLAQSLCLSGSVLSINTFVRV